MSPDMILLLLLLLAVKHLVIDFPLQGPYQYLNKGTYGHWGGIQHSWYHSIGTFFVLSFFATFPSAVALAFLDYLAHYHIDWAKVQINKKMGWGPTTHEQFWLLLGFDQFLHTLTYLGIVYALV